MQHDDGEPSSCDELRDVGEHSRLWSAAAHHVDDERMDPHDESMMAEVKAAVLGTEHEGGRIGRFKVVRVIGMGGMGKVFEAEDPDLGRRVAIKLHKDDSSSPVDRERMRREARMLGQLVHENVVRVYEVGEHEHRTFVVMELVPGQTLSDLRDAGPMQWQRVVALYSMAGRGLEAAHDKGIVHRDFKPGNVIIDESDRAKVVDFGLARAVLPEGAEETAAARAADSGAVERIPVPVITNTGALLGTPPYMAPELFQGKPATPHSDQFAFCVSLYETLFGRRPFPGKTMFELMASMTEDAELAPEDARDVPTWLLEVVRKGLSLDPNDRYRSMGELLVDLERGRVARWGWVRLPLAFAAGVVALWLVLAITVADFDRVGEEPARVVAALPAKACLADAVELGAGWRARSAAELTDGLDDVRASIGSEIAQLAEQVGESCLEPVPRYSECRAAVQRDLDARLQRIDRQDGAPATAFSGLAKDFELCREYEASGRCSGSEDDGGSAATLSEASAALAFGEPEAAEALAVQALALARVHGDRLAEARAQTLLGRVFDQTERLDEARLALDAALAIASQCEASVSIVDVALARVEVELHHRQAGPAVALALPLALAREHLDDPALGSLRMRRALLAEKEGGVRLMLERRCEDALAPYQLALQLRQEALSERERQGRPTAAVLRWVADAELNLATAMLECGDEPIDAVIARFEAARGHHLEGLGGRVHPDLASFSYGLARALALGKRYEEAEHHYEDALDTYARYGGADSGSVADVHQALAETLRRMGRLDAAREHAEANVLIRRNNPRATSPLTMAEALTAVGTLAAMAEDYEDAHVNHSAAIQQLLSISGELNRRDHETLAAIYANDALALCGLGRVDDASHAYEEARRWQVAPDQLSVQAVALREHGCLR